MARERWKPADSRARRLRRCFPTLRSSRGKAVSGTRSGVAGSSNWRSPAKRCGAVARRAPWVARLPRFTRTSRSSRCPLTKRTGWFARAMPSVARTRRFSSAMLERYLQALSVNEPDGEDLPSTRERLKDRFPRGATRRMTQLGFLVVAVFEDLSPQPDDALVYASAYAETRALEGYLDSFPAASPTLFQTSIHPSAVQQALITRQLQIGEFFPLTGRAHLATHAVQAA